MMAQAIAKNAASVTMSVGRLSRRAVMMQEPRSPAVCWFYEAGKQAGTNRSDAMADNNRFEIPQEMRSMAEASFDQARKAFESFLGQAHQTASTLTGTGETARANAKDITAKAISFAEKNVQASLSYAQQLVHASDLTEIMRLHSEYVQAQMKALAEQASEMGQAVTKAAMDNVKPR